ncbi:EF-hand domain-containing protein [Amycolatopsis australiensis]|uniref:Ca2+-binding protein, EF-hand superfamily n=1 Tax=Amycolatopsis australiensis TaxID=546364 RepID=A0A1K1SVC3_9PSEU|nr:EF-hand domain-containing protein [Amycolatopsis australiensis]SFW88266.1 Ca2+-binding protein, EF-hand superfamily [Amycolatopsis australiensis]
MASDFQRRKISGVFDAMDADGDGVLTESDFRALTRRWLDVRGTDGNTPEGQHLAAIMMGWWGTLDDAAGHGGRVTLEQVLRVVDELPAMPGAVTGTAAAMFEAVDENGDGVISAEEYRRMIEAWSGGRAPSEDVFAHLDLDGDGKLSRDEFTGHWFEFWAGDDPAAPGSWVFGRV